MDESTEHILKSRLESGLLNFPDIWRKQNLSALTEAKMWYDALGFCSSLTALTVLLDLFLPP